MAATWAIVAALLSGCQTLDTAQELLLPESMGQSNGIRTGSVSPTTLSTATTFNEAQQPQIYPGTGELVGGTDELANGGGTPGRNADASDSEDGVRLNLVNVEIAQAVKTVLGDVLQLNYVIDPRVGGRITVQTTRPVPNTSLADIFDATLRANGAAIVDDGSGVFKVVPLDQALGAMPDLQVSRLAPSQRTVGVGIQVVPLSYISASEMSRVLQPIAPGGSILLVDDARNLLMLAGTRNELSALLEAVYVFDVDWMQGMSFALVPVRTSDPETISDELATIFNAGGEQENTVVRFLPNRRLRSILIITSRPHYLVKAQDWIRRLDAAAVGEERQLYVYNVQNRTAEELANLLQQVFAAQGGGDITVTASVAPRFDAAVLEADGAIIDEAPVEAQARAALGASTRSGVVVVADGESNALLIVASPHEYRRTLSMLEQLDAIRNQVLIEATIAEVSLRDELDFGLRWFFETHDAGSFTFTDAASGAVASLFPGFSYFFSSSNVLVALNAIRSITDVNVVSSPTLMVLDNETAVLQVGAQVPVAIQSAVSVTDPGAPIVNTIEFRDTGVILSVTPRVNDSGRVILEIEQEVSDVVTTTTSGIDSPTIQQRKIKTTVVVNDGDSLALGGLIQDRHTDTRGQVPIVGDIPILGTLFRDKSDDAEKTELLIIITPRVVRDLAEARSVTDEFRRQLDIVVPEISRDRGNVERELGRIVN